MAKRKVGNKIELALQSSHFTIPQAATLLNVSVKNLRSWIKGQENPSLEDWLNLMDLTRTKVDFFVNPAFCRTKCICDHSDRYAFPQELEERIENLEQVLAHMLHNHNYQ